MTLIAAYASANEQILVADRRLTDGLTGKLITDQSYKVLYFQHSGNGFAFAVGFTGLATAGPFKTMDWLVSALPVCFSGSTSIGDCFERFRQDCSKTFRSLPVRTEYKNTTFVFAGYINTTGAMDHEAGVISVSNAPGPDGAVSDEFSVRPNVNRPDEDMASFCRVEYFGNVAELARRNRTRIRVERYLRRNLSASLKLELLARLVRTIGRAGSNVGKDVLGICVRRGASALGGEWPAAKGRRETMPPFLSSSGVYFSDASMPPSNAEQLSDFED